MELKKPNSVWAEYSRDEDGVVRPHPLVKIHLADRPKDSRVEMTGKARLHVRRVEVVYDVDDTPIVRIHTYPLRPEEDGVQAIDVDDDLQTVPTVVYEVDLADVEFSGKLSSTTWSRPGETKCC